MDLGIYKLKITLADGTLYENDYDASWRMISGRWTTPFDSERELIYQLWWIYTEGNWSCDCNLAADKDKALGLFNGFWDEEKDCKKYPCGESLLAKSLVAVRPDGSELQII